MSTPKYADFVINEDGSFTVEAHGFDGKGCREFTEAIEKALGSVTAVVVKAPAKKVVAPQKNQIVR